MRLRSSLVQDDIVYHDDIEKYCRQLRKKSSLATLEHKQKQQKRGELTGRQMGLNNILTSNQEEKELESSENADKLTELDPNRQQEVLQQVLSEKEKNNSTKIEVEPQQMEITDADIKEKSDEKDGKEKFSQSQSAKLDIGQQQSKSTNVSIGNKETEKSNPIIPKVDTQTSETKALKKPDSLTNESVGSLGSLSIRPPAEIESQDSIQATKDSSRLIAQQVLDKSKTPKTGATPKKQITVKKTPVTERKTPLMQKSVAKTRLIDSFNQKTPVASPIQQPLGKHHQGEAFDEGGTENTETLIFKARTRLAEMTSTLNETATKDIRTSTDENKTNVSIDGEKRRKEIEKELEERNHSIFHKNDTGIVSEVKEVYNIDKQTIEPFSRSEHKSLTESASPSKKKSVNEANCEKNQSFVNENDLKGVVYQEEQERIEKEHELEQRTMEEDGRRKEVERIERELEEQERIKKEHELEEKMKQELFMQKEQERLAKERELEEKRKQAEKEREERLRLEEERLLEEKRKKELEELEHQKQEMIKKEQELLERLEHEENERKEREKQEKEEREQKERDERRKREMEQREKEEKERREREQREKEEREEREREQREQEERERIKQERLKKEREIEERARREKEQEENRRREEMIRQKEREEREKQSLLEKEALQRRQAFAEAIRQVEESERNRQAEQNKVKSPSSIKASLSITKINRIEQDRQERRQQEVHRTPQEVDLQHNPEHQQHRGDGTVWGTRVQELHKELSNIGVSPIKKVVLHKKKPYQQSALKEQIPVIEPAGQEETLGFKQHTAAHTPATPLRAKQKLDTSSGAVYNPYAALLPSTPIQPSKLTDTSQRGETPKEMPPPLFTPRKNRTPSARDTMSPQYPMSDYIDSEKEDDDERAAKRRRKAGKIPHWAKGERLEQELVQQRSVNPEAIFSSLHTRCNLEEMFAHNPAALAHKQSWERHTYATNWVNDRNNPEEEAFYNRMITFHK